MPTRSDFNVIPVRRPFNSSNNSFVANFPIEGAKIVDDGYLVMQVRGVGEPGTHRIKLNGNNIEGNFDFQPAPGGSQAWLAWMTTFKPNLLKPNDSNRIEIERVGNDNFEVGDIVINWRERD